MAVREQRTDKGQHLTLLQRINAVRADVGYIQKDKSVDLGKRSYKVVTHDMVTAAIRGACIKHGVIIYPHLLDSQTSDSGLLTGRGNPIHLYSASYQINFVCVDDKDDVISIRIESHALDEGDKAPGKALSYAQKYALLKMFMLETGEDEESRIDTRVYTEEQFDRYHALLESESAVEFYALLKPLDVRIKTALHNSFPDGAKTKGKRLADALYEKGRKHINDLAHELAHAIDVDDSLAVREQVGELSPVEKQLVWAALTPDHKGKAKVLMEE